jgi:cytochrome bd-type quinol oxidase subunit 2
MKRIALSISLNLLLICSAGFLPLARTDALTSAMSTNVVASSVAANEACQGVGLLSGGGCSDNGQQVTNVLGTIITIFSAIVGIIAVVMIIVAGLQFITSNGNPQNVSKARMSLIYAIVGIVIVIAAQTIVHFAISQAKT